MTDTVFYDDMFALATELMNDFGTPATLRRVTKSKPDAEGKATVTTEEWPGLAVKITDEEMLDLMDLGGDVAYAIKFPVEPKAGWTLIHAGSAVELLKGKLVNPEGTRLIMAFFSGKFE